MFGWFKKTPQIETRSIGAGFTSDLLYARESYLAGRQGIAEMTATVQSCVSLWEGGLSLADVSGTNLLSRQVLGMTARALAFRGEALFLIEGDRLVPCSEWDLSTRNARPTGYRVTIPEIGGGKTQQVLAAEVLHFRTGVDIAAPYFGQSPLKRSQLTAGTLNAIETALAEIYENAPLGSSIVPFPESSDTDMGKIGREFRGKRGRILLRESVNVTAAAGPAPTQDWRASDLSPDLQRSLISESGEAARGAISMAFGVLPAMLNPSATGPVIREGQRHLAQWALQPVAAAMAEECTEKLGSDVQIDTMRPLQAYDSGGRARAAMGVIQALAAAKEAGVDPQQAFELVDWQ